MFPPAASRQRQDVTGDGTGRVFADAANGVGAALRTNGEFVVLQILGNIYAGRNSVRIVVIFYCPLLLTAVYLAQVVDAIV